MRGPDHYFWNNGCPRGRADVGRAMAYPTPRWIDSPSWCRSRFRGSTSRCSNQLTQDGIEVALPDGCAPGALDNAVKLEGSVRHAGTHASAVVMSEKPLVNYTPLQRTTGGGEEIITQYSMKPIEEIGLLKMDFLGLKNLTIIQGILHLLKTSKPRLVWMVPDERPGNL